jgi:hypothetical protein
MHGADETTAKFQRSIRQEGVGDESRIDLFTGEAGGDDLNLDLIYRWIGSEIFATLIVDERSKAAMSAELPTMG